MYPPSSSPTPSLSGFILIIASLTVGGLVRLWLSAYLSAPASEKEEEEEAAEGARVCGYAAEGRVWCLLLICCGYISSIRLIASVYCCGRAAEALQCGRSGQNMLCQQHSLVGVSMHGGASIPSVSPSTDCPSL